MHQASGYRYQVSGFARLVLALMFGFASFSCAGEQAGNAHTASGQSSATNAAAEARVEATHGSSTQASTSASVTGDAEQYRLSCRMQTYIFKEDMSKAEVKDFTSRITYRVQANLNGGGNKNLGDLLDDIDVPAYEGLCG